MKIIYINTSGVLAVIHPCDCGIPIGEIARKDVPAGVPFLVVEDSEIPTDRTYRDAWTSDFSAPHGYGIGPDAWFSEQAAMAAAQEDSP